jgi:hypothetical protein
LDKAIVDRKSHRTLLWLLILLALANLLLAASAYLGFTVFKEQVIRSGRAFMEAQQGTPLLPRSLEYYYSLVEERYEKKLALYLPDNIVMYLPVLLVLLCLPLYSLRQKLHLSPGKCSYAILGLTLLDIALTGMSFMPTIPPQDIFPMPDAVRFLKQDAGVYRVCGTNSVLTPNSGMVFGISDVRGYDLVVPRRYEELISRVEGHFRFHSHSLFTQVDSSLLDLLNVKYVLTDQELGGRWELVYQDAGSVRVYRNQNVMPRAFVVYRAQVVDSAGRSLEYILGGDFDFRNTVLLEELPAGWTQPPKPHQVSATVQIVHYEPNRITIEVGTEADGLLVLTDTYAQGWKATLDERDTPVYVANHAFRAVAVPAGTHQVEFVYQPRGFQAGATVTLIAIAALVLIGLVSWIRHTRESVR